MKISVIGLGYVGLPTAVLLASSGHSVLGVDVNLELILKLNSGSFTSEDEMINKAYREIINTPRFSAANILHESDVFIVAVPTPVLEQKIDLTYVRSVCEDIARVLKKGNLVIVESTISPGTTNGTVRTVLEQSGLRAGQDFYLAHIPERVQPGNIHNELVNNNRVVGGIDTTSTQKAKEVYLSFVKGKIEETDSITAETCKVVENTFRDVNIAFANELLIICEKIGVDPWRIIELANNHPRVNILSPGPGVGGHCIPVDPWFLIEQAPESAKLLINARNRNDQMPIKVAQDIRNILQDIGGKRVSLLGCTYKANTSDARETPTEIIVEQLTTHGISFATFDPHVIRKWVSMTHNLQDCIKDSDLMVMIIPHKEFISIKPSEIASVTKCRVIFDCTNTLNVEDWKNEGFEVVLFGKINTYLSLHRV
jgi:UDP-N-acetyl-D-mannosaminuronic acid dehydrogenase